MDVDFTGEISSKCHSMDAPERAACARWMARCMMGGFALARSTFDEKSLLIKVRERLSGRLSERRDRSLIDLAKQTGRN